MLQSLSKNPYHLVLPLLVVVATLYYWPFNATPYFFAEDGAYLFKESLELGWRSILAQVIGQFAILQRLIAYLISFLPVTWIPLAYPLAATMVTIIAVAWFARPGFRWLIKSDWIRMLLCCSFLLCPGGGELLTIVMALNWIFFMWAILLLLEHDPEGKFNLSTSRAVGVAILLSSSAQSLLLLPLISYLYFIYRSRSYLALVLVIAVIAWMNVGNTQSYEHDFPVLELSVKSLVYVLQVFFDNLFVRFSVIPLVGSFWANKIMNLPLLAVYFLSIIPLGSLFFFFWKKKVRPSIFCIVLLTLFGINLLVPLTSIVRTYTYGFLTLPPPINLYSRYSFLAAAASLILYVNVIECFFPKRIILKSLALFIVIINVISTSPSPIATTHLKDNNPGWRTTASSIEAAISASKAGKLDSAVEFELECMPRDWTGGAGPLTILPIDRDV